MSSLKQEAELCHRHALQLFHTEKYNEALDYFTKAIALDPDFADAYHYRGELLNLIGRIVEGNTDLQKAKFLRSGLLSKKQKKERKISKVNLQETASILDQVFPAEGMPVQEETVDFDNKIYDYAFSDDTMETGRLWDGLVADAADTKCTPAILEYAGGRREEVFRAQLFQPSAGEITILLEESDNSKRIVPLGELNCVRLQKLPAGCEQKSDPSGQIEIVETRDGNIYHELIPPQQSLAGGLLGFSTKKNTHFPYTFFPEANIKLRYQERFLGDILLEKRFIADDILKSALEEHESLRHMQLGKIIARQANILYSVVETTLAKAQRSGLEGLRTGEILLDAGLVNDEQILDALDYQTRIQSKKLGAFLVEKGILREKELYISLSEKFRMPFVDLRQQKVAKKVLTILPRELVLRYKVLPIALKESTLVVASPSPEVTVIRDEIQQHINQYQLEFVLAQPTHLKNVVNILYQDQRNPAEFS